MLLSGSDRFFHTPTPLILKTFKSELVYGSELYDRMSGGREGVGSDTVTPCIIRSYDWSIYQKVTVEMPMDVGTKSGQIKS